MVIGFESPLIGARPPRDGVFGQLSRGEAATDMVSDDIKSVELEEGFALI